MTDTLVRDQVSDGALPGDLRERLERLRARRLVEDERLVCLERARIIAAGRERHGHLSRARRQAAIIRDLCAQISIVIEPEHVLLGCAPEILPTADEEVFIAEHPELFIEAGVPGWLDSLSIFIPDWDWLVTEGLDGISAAIGERRAGAQTPDACEFLEAAQDALASVALLLRRYAEEARRQGLHEAAARCERVAGPAPTSFADALQLLQMVHMVLSCLIGGRDVTPGRLDQYLWPLYEADVAVGRLTRDNAVGLLAHCFLRLSQMTGNDTDFDDNLRRTPCQYSHLYVTIGGVTADGRPATNDLSFGILDALDLLAYKEPTVLVRWTRDMDAGFAARVAELVSRRRPITIYSDDAVIAGLTRQRVPEAWARDYAHSACHNVLVPGHEAGSGPGGFHNVPRMLLQALDAPEAGESFERLTAALRREMRAELQQPRAASERRWQETLAPAVPLLQSALMRESLAAARPCWRAASISHLNHYLSGLATTVDALVALRRLVFAEQRLSLAEFRDLLACNWDGAEDLRREIQTRLPRYGQDDPEAHESTREVGEMWVEEVEAAAQGMQRLVMWPAFYSHMRHLGLGAATGATPDGRRAGEPLSENLGPSRGTPPCAPTSVLSNMAAVPLDHTASGATSLTLLTSDFAGEAGRARLVSLIGTCFAMGGLQLHLNLIDATTLQAAMAEPEAYADLTVRVTGFSALFTRLSEDVQRDLLARAEGSAPSA